MGRHRHVVNVRADGIAVVLGPLLRDVRIVAAALVDVDSGMVLDAWSAAATDATTGSPDLELIGAQHAEIVRTALALLQSWPAGGGTPGTCEVVLGADDGARHLLRAVPDPYGDRLALAVVVNGPQRVLDRVRKRLQAVSVDALTAGPSMTRRPLGGGWSFDPPGPDVPAHSEPAAGPGPVSMPGPRTSEPAGAPVVGVHEPLGPEPGPVLQLPGRPAVGPQAVAHPTARRAVAGSVSGSPRPPSPPAALPAPAPSRGPKP